jgi:hypothetical protein
MAIIWTKSRGMNASFFAGLIFGLSLLSFAGFYIHKHETGFANYVRLTRYIDDITLYQSTSQQLYATVKSSLPPNIRNVVVISGDSVLWGFCQNLEALWSRILQEKLGAEFYVVNLARPAGSYMDNGAPIAAALLREGFNVTLIFDEWPPTLRGTSGPYRQIYWDAVYTKLIRRFSDYDKLNQPDQDNPISKDIRFGLWLDSFFHFRALWSYIAYNYFSVIWTPEVGFSRRKDFGDPPQVPDLPPLGARYPPASQAREVAAVKSKVRLACPMESSVRDDARSRFKNSLPEELRKRTLVVSIYDSPFYVNREVLSSQELECYKQAYTAFQSDYVSAGYRGIIVDSLTVDEYCDRLHLTASGGRKLADIVARELLTHFKN